MFITRRQFLKYGTSAVCMAGLPALAKAGAIVGGVRIETGPAFGSSWRLVVADTVDVPLARRTIETIVHRVDGRMSPFRADSELTRFNNARKGLTLSIETAKVVAMALDLANASDGAFDPTAGPIVRRYGFGSPSITAGRPAGHFRDLRLNGRVLGMTRPGLSLDLCAIAKGHALDEIMAKLDGLDCLVELGGEIAAIGHHPSGRPWRMGIERPGSNSLQRIIHDDGRALATSGNATQGYVIGEKRYGHVVDPRTGGVANGNIASVSVLAPNAMLADGLATAAMVLGSENAREPLAAFDASALFIMRDGPGLREVDVMGFTGKRSL